MPMDRFFIVPMDQGLQTNAKPWLILDQAFARLENVYPFRKRIRKRWGSATMGILGQFSSRLRINIGTTAAVTGNLGPVVVGPAGTTYTKGQMFSVGSNTFMVISDTPGPQPTLSTSAATATFDVATGTLTITGNNVNPNTIVYFYPCYPVMGFAQYFNSPQNQQPTYAFDTRFAYNWNGSSWQRSGTGTNPRWQGDNLDFFSVANWYGATPDINTLFVTNFNYTLGAPLPTDDPIWYTPNGITWTAVTGANGWYYAPNGGAPQTGDYISTCKFIIPYKGRLVLLYPIQNVAGNNVAFRNRAFSCFNGSPFARNAWYLPNQADNGAGAVNNNDIAAGAQIVDADTDEEIISWGFIKDRLIVFFTNSTWELCYTGSQQNPFLWQKLNTELGSESQNSTVPFDRELLTIGLTGVHACNGSNVERIDQAIPDTIFQIRDANLSPERVCGIRDYTTECVYWAYPQAYTPSDDPYPNRILLYNYREPGWSILIDSVTAFGYYYQTTQTTWADLADLTWARWQTPWNSGRDQLSFRQIIMGNQQGWVTVIRPDLSRNAPTLSITNITALGQILTLTVIDHNLDVGDYILIENAQGINNLNNNIYRVWRINDKDTLFINAPGVTGAYTGSGTIARVSNYEIWSKQWNPYDKQGRNVYISKIDFAVTNSLSGQVVVDSFPSSSELSTLDTAVPGTLVCTGILETGPYPAQFAPLEQYQELLWHPLYLQIEGENIQIRMYMNDEQMRNPNISLADFELQGLILHTQSTSNRLQ